MHTPPRLSAFLDYGGDLAGFPGLEGLAESVIVGRRLNTCAQNAAQAAFNRQCVARWVAEGPEAIQGPAFAGTPITQSVVTAFAWAAECYEDTCLAARFEAAIPAHLYRENIQWATERQARAGS